MECSSRISMCVFVDISFQTHFLFQLCIGSQKKCHVLYSFTVACWFPSILQDNGGVVCFYSLNITSQDILYKFIVGAFAYACVFLCLPLYNVYIFTHLLLKYDLYFLFCIACVRHFNRAVMWGCRTPWRVTRQRPAVQCIFISVLSVTAKACTAPSGNKNQVTWPTGITCDFMLCQLLKLFLAHLCLLLFILSFFHAPLGTQANTLWMVQPSPLPEGAL